MLKKHNKDFLERLINHTMRHGKKAAAIGLLTKSFLLFKQNLTRQAGVSRHLHLRRAEKRAEFLCTLLNPAVPSQQSSLALGVNMNQEKPLKATIPPHLNKKIDLTNQSIYISTGSLTNPHIAVSFCKQNDDVTRLVYDIACNGKTNLWITGNVWIGEDKIGNTSSNPMSCNKMPSATIERKTTSAMVYAQDVSRGNNDKTRARSRNSRCSVSGFLKDAISNIKPSLETRKKKIAGITRHVPSIVSPSRGEGLAIRWVLAAAKEKQRKGGKELSKCLSDELLDAYLKRGEARQKRDSLHKLAESNRSYVRYRWW